MSNPFKRHLGEGGDTIVEVMIVLAVLGLAMSISYATANKSLLATRAAQESASANVLLQTQVEYLRSIVGSGTPMPALGASFCIDTAANAGAGGVVPNSTLPACNPGIYKIIITVGSNSTYTAKATWEDVSGQLPDDSATLIYRVYP
jgi:hypothetical protein